MTTTTRDDKATDERLPLADTPLGRTIATTATDIWNDSCSIPELEYAISFGAVGATANPTIVTDVWKQDRPAGATGSATLAAERPDATVSDLAWAVVEEMSIARRRPAGAGLRGPAAARAACRSRPTRRSTGRRTGMLAQGVQFTTLAPNIIVKFPATAAGIGAIEEATARGVSVNVTVSFTVAQAVAAAEASSAACGGAKPRR